MIRILRTDAHSKDYRRLVTELDKDLAIRDGADHGFFAQYNISDDIKHVVVAYLDGRAVGCGAIKAYEANVAEVKRMYVPPIHRGKGIASLVLRELEKWAMEKDFKYAVLETSIHFHTAIRLYQTSGYQIISNYGPYVGLEESVCMNC